MMRETLFAVCVLNVVVQSYCENGVTALLQTKIRGPEVEALSRIEPEGPFTVTHTSEEIHFDPQKFDDAEKSRDKTCANCQPDGAAWEAKPCYHCSGKTDAVNLIDENGCWPDQPCPALEAEIDNHCPPLGASCNDGKSNYLCAGYCDIYAIFSPDFHNGCAGGKTCLLQTEVNQQTGNIDDAENSRDETCANCQPDGAAWEAKPCYHCSGKTDAVNLINENGCEPDQSCPALEAEIDNHCPPLGESCNDGKSNYLCAGYCDIYAIFSPNIHAEKGCAGDKTCL